MMLLDIFQEDVPIEIFNISLESTQNKQQYGTRVTSIAVRGGKAIMIGNMCCNVCGLMYAPPPTPKKKWASA